VPPLWVRPGRTRTVAEAPRAFSQGLAPRATPAPGRPVAHRAEHHTWERSALSDGRSDHPPGRL